MWYCFACPSTLQSLPPPFPDAPRTGVRRVLHSCPPFPVFGRKARDDPPQVRDTLKAARPVAHLRFFSGKYDIVAPALQGHRYFGRDDVEGVSLRIWQAFYVADIAYIEREEVSGLVFNRLMFAHPRYPNVPRIGRKFDRLPLDVVERERAFGQVDQPHRFWMLD